MRPEQLIDESRVRVDKTSQLLVSMALAVAQLAKPAYKHPGNQTARSKDFKHK